MISDTTAPGEPDWMQRALALARRGLETTTPNPCVGCVLVRDGRMVGEGWHERAGEPHAEVHALRMAGDAARGSTAYVTLEPCSHTGRTGPCCEALIAAATVHDWGKGDPRFQALLLGTTPFAAMASEILLAKSGSIPSSVAARPAPL